jgi:hypothetical protein
MKEEITYQNDSVKGKIPVENIHDFREAGELRIDRAAPVSLESLQIRKPSAQSDTATKSEPAKPTAEQLRYWWWQREKKLLVGDSRQAASRDAVEVVTSVKHENTGLQLPSRKIDRQDSDWIVGVLLLVLVIFASVRTSYSKYLVHLFRSLFNYPTSSRMFREKNYPALHAAYRLDIFFYIIFSLFIFQAIDYFKVKFEGNNIRLFLWCLGIATGFYLLKKMVYKFTGKLTECESEVDEYLFNMDNVNRIAGLILLPVVLVNMFFPFQNAGLMIYPGIFILVFLYFKVLLRGILILFRKQFSIFYLFLYFCTLEFVPLVLLYKILSQ